MASPIRVAAVVCALALAGCNQDQQMISAAQPRGATVAFESIDGPPPAQFHALVQSLNEEAQSRRLAVISREQPSAYRVRGYLAAEVDNDKTTISWVWDVFDRSEQRALRIDGSESIDGHERNAWHAATETMLRRIAHASMDQLAVFLTSPEVAPGTPAGATQIALAEQPASSPEAAGIFRIFHPRADPVSTDNESIPPMAADDTGIVPLPRRRPETPVVISARYPLTLAASSMR